MRRARLLAVCVGTILSLVARPRLQTCFVDPMLRHGVLPLAIGHHGSLARSRRRFELKQFFSAEASPSSIVPEAM